MAVLGSPRSSLVFSLTFLRFSRLVLRAKTENQIFDMTEASSASEGGSLDTFAAPLHSIIIPYLENDMLLLWVGLASVSLALTIPFALYVLDRLDLLPHGTIQVVQHTTVTAPPQCQTQQQQQQERARSRRVNSARRSVTGGGSAAASTTPSLSGTTRSRTAAHASKAPDDSMPRAGSPTPPPPRSSPEAHAQLYHTSPFFTRPSDDLRASASNSQAPPEGSAGRVVELASKHGSSPRRASSPSLETGKRSAHREELTSGSRARRSTLPAREEGEEEDDVSVEPQSHPHVDVKESVDGVLPASPREAVDEPAVHLPSHDDEMMDGGAEEEEDEEGVAEDVDAAAEVDDEIIIPPVNIHWGDDTARDEERQQQYEYYEDDEEDDYERVRLAMNDMELQMEEQRQRMERLERQVESTFQLMVNTLSTLRALDAPSPLCTPRGLY